MLKKYSFIKCILAAFTVVFLIILFYVVKIIWLYPSENNNLKSITVNDIPYIINDIPSSRGKILAIVTSTETLGTSKKKTGYELTELSRAYYVFKANGFEVDIASPLGGKPPVIIDDEDMGAFDYAFINDSIAQKKVAFTIQLKNVIPEQYNAVYFVGGKGAMFDFPNNKKIQLIIKGFHNKNNVIGAVCHGPAALVNVTLDNGDLFVKDRRISSFTNKEELLFIPKAETIFPFLLQDELVNKGAKFNEGLMYLEKISHDKNLITGQNPWSVWTLSETMIKQMGYIPKQRVITDEENAVNVLHKYHKYGTKEAKHLIKEIILNKQQSISINLLIDHSIMSIIKGELIQFNTILGLASYVKEMSNN